MEKRALHSPDLTVRNFERLAELFPQVITETRDAEGNVTLAVDFDLLRQELSDHIVEGPQERYQLDWPGKRAAAFVANAPIAKTLRPVREESVDFDSTRNLFIEGDNLDALKLLQESYLEKVKLIYIDPPYNTGSDFVYEDDFAESSAEYLARSGQKSESGDRLVANPESNGRFHSDWLSMMYPRLKLARNLLTADGVLLISVNDREVANLRHIAEEVFGTQNFVVQFVWLNEGNVDQQSRIKGVHEYVLAFARSADFVGKPTVIDPNIEESSKLFRERIENSITKNGPANPPSIVELPVGFPAAFGSGRIEPRKDKFPHVLDVIEVSDGKIVRPARVRSGWSSRNLLDLFVSNGCVPIRDSEGRETWFELRDTGAIYGLKRRSDTQGHVLSVLRNMGTTKQNSSMLAGWGVEFSYPKPVYLVQYLVSLFTSDSGGEIVMDFFAGSATTAHGVMAANLSDGGDRRHVLVQLAEPAGDGKTIAQLARKRIVAAARSLQQSPSPGVVARAIDAGFRTFRVDTTNFANVAETSDGFEQWRLDGMVDSVKPDRTDEDLLFQVLLDWGLDLSEPVAVEEFGSRRLLSIDDGALVACFAESVTPEVVRVIADREPLRAVFRDDAFESDAQRINAEQVFREVSPATEVRTI